MRFICKIRYKWWKGWFLWFKGLIQRFTLESSQIQRLQKEIKSLFGVVKTLHEKLKAKKDQLRGEKQQNCISEHNIRQQLTTEFQKILTNTESHYKKQLDFKTENKERKLELMVEVMRNCESRVEILN